MRKSVVGPAEVLRSLVEAVSRELGAEMALHVGEHVHEAFVRQSRLTSIGIAVVI